MITVLDQGRPYSFDLDAMNAYHGPVAPGGVAHAIKIMELTFPILSPDAPLERGELEIKTAFGGPGARDAFELVTRAVTGGRYDVDPAHAAKDESLGYRAKYTFRLTYRGKTVSVVVKDNIVRDEFLALGGKPDRSKDENLHLAWLKQEMTDRILSLHCSAVYEIIEG